MAERGKRFGDQLTPGNYCCDEVASAPQKAIRRGEEREALFWASELDLAGFGNYVWKRLLVIASEDVGLALTETVLAVRPCARTGTSCGRPSSLRTKGSCACSWCTRSACWRERRSRVFSTTH